MKVTTLLLLIASLLGSAKLVADATITITEDRYNELKEKAGKWEEAEKKKEEEPPKKPEPPKRSDLKINLINDTGFKAYVRTKVRPVEAPFQYIEVQGASKDETTTLGSIQSDPNSTFEIVDIDGVPATFQLVVDEGSALYPARCTLSDPEKKVAKKTVDFYVTKAKNASYATCTIHLDFAP